jgi:hydrogenase maturation protease
MGVPGDPSGGWPGGGTGSGSGEASGRVLVVGYGNPLRGDDGVGPAVASALASAPGSAVGTPDPRLAGLEILIEHQLTPELAGDVAQARLVVLVDARLDGAPGSVSVRAIDGAAASASDSSHHVGPATLIALARELWGAAPPMYAVTVGVASTELGEGLSAVAEAAIPAAVEAVLELVAASPPRPGTPAP